MWIEGALKSGLGLEIETCEPVAWIVKLAVSVHVVLDDSLAWF
jgi:hypothetical protein